MGKLTPKQPFGFSTQIFSPNDSPAHGIWSWVVGILSTPLHKTLILTRLSEIQIQIAKARAINILLFCQIKNINEGSQ